MFIDRIVLLERELSPNVFSPCSPNDLVLVGEDRFYTSNDQYLPYSLRLIEVMFRLSLGSVAYYDGREARIVAGGLKISNGVNMSPDKK